VATFDLHLLPIHRLNGQDYADLPGLLALTPPRRVARGREKDSLVLYLLLSGNANFTTAEINELKDNAAHAFYQSAGTLTSAMRKAAETINAALLQRNLATTSRGQYALGLLALAVVREAQCTLLLSGPTHAVWVGNGQARHVHDTALSGKGLGSSQSVQAYLAQVELHADDLLILCGTFPKDWEADLLGERPQTSLEASYRKLTFTKGDLNAVIVQPQNGHGVITVLHAEVSAPPPSQPTPVSISQAVPTAESFEPRSREVREEDMGLEVEPESPVSNDQLTVADSPSITEEELDELADFAAHMLQPSAYAIPPQPDDLMPPILQQEATIASPSQPRSFPPSIPRIQPVEPPIESEPGLEDELEDEILDEEETVEAKPSLLGGLKDRFNKPKASPLSDATRGKSKPDAHALATRQMAKAMVGGIRTGRRVNEGLRSFLQRFIPRLLPGAEHPEEVEGEPVQQQMFFMPTYALVFIAIVIPVLVVTIALVVYLRFGQSVQYDEYYSQALDARAKAVSETDPMRQREAWQNVLNYVKKAEEYRKTDDSKQLRNEAQGNLDSLLGVVRLEFIPAFTNGLSGTTTITRMAASESDLYMLDAEKGSILHATFTGRSLELDNTFNCQPGTYVGYEVGTLVDLIALPKVNLAGATVLGIDATGHLLYCAPGQVPQAIPLPALPNTNWGRITSFVMDSGNLYVLDATSRAVWVFVGKDSTFTDTPYFYFGNQIPNTIDTAIDLAVSGDDLYLLHADGHVSTCTFSRIEQAPTKCVDPLNFLDPFPAHQDLNLFVQANFTQMSLTTPPNSVILLLDSENRQVFRFTPRSLELQNQVTGHAGEGNPFEPAPVTAMTVSPNYVLYFAIGNQVYFATNLP
jgi:hypothetical protein